MPYCMVKVQTFKTFREIFRSARNNLKKLELVSLLGCGLTNLLVVNKLVPSKNLLQKSFHVVNNLYK